MKFEYNKQLWPWCGWLGVYIYAEHNDLDENNMVSVSEGLEYRLM